MLSATATALGPRLTNRICPRLLRLRPSDAVPGSETQWIFWPRTGARLRASHENSQSRPNCVVASVQREKRASSGCTVTLFVAFLGVWCCQGGRQRRHTNTAQQRTRARAPPSSLSSLIITTNPSSPLDPRHPLRDALAVVPERPAGLERRGHLDLGAALKPRRHAPARAVMRRRRQARAGKARLAGRAACIVWAVDRGWKNARLTLLKRAKQAARVSRLRSASSLAHTHTPGVRSTIAGRLVLQVCRRSEKERERLARSRLQQLSRAWAGARAASGREAVRGVRARAISLSRTPRTRTALLHRTVADMAVRSTQLARSRRVCVGPRARERARARKCLAAIRFAALCARL